MTEIELETKDGAHINRFAKSPTNLKFVMSSGGFAVLMAVLTIYSYGSPLTPYFLISLIFSIVELNTTLLTYSLFGPMAREINKLTKTLENAKDKSTNA
jgi:hypothetical protein